jgi:hypothetical protein
VGDYENQGYDRQAALDKVKPVSIAIMVVGALGVLGSLMGLALALFGTGLGAIAGREDADKFGALVGGGFQLALYGFAVIVYAIALFGGFKMSKLDNYVLAWVGTVASAMPCFLCCCIPFGVPVAIWSAIVLMDDNVRNAFARG